MKKFLLPLFAVAALLTACNEERYDAPQFQKGVTFTVPDFIEEAGTRVAVTIDNSGANFTWTEGDTLGVFPSNGYQTAFPISGGAGTNTAVFDGADWALRPNASYAAYYPFSPSMQLDKTKIEVSYLGQTQNGNGSTAHIGDYDYLAAKYSTVSASGDVNFTLNHLGCLVRFQLTMPEADTYTNMTLSCEGSMLTTAGKFDLTAATPALSAKSQDASISLALENVATTEANQVLTLYMMLPPMDLSGKNLSIKVSGEKDYEATVAGKDMKAGSIYGYTNTLSAPHEYVDLGLSVMWATCNVGANSPEEYGGYFAWGETETKAEYEWDNYKYKGEEYDILKYGKSADKMYTLEACDDAASVNWGAIWRMPTNEEFYELLECACTWTTRNEVAGYLIKGKNGNEFFLPAAGYKEGSKLYEVGTRGQYWSNTFSPFLANSAAGLYFDSSFDGQSHKTCYSASSIRPVCPNPNFTRISTIQISEAEKQLTPSDTLQLHVTVVPENASNQSIRWWSNNHIATVSADGLVTAIAAGTATITAYANDGSGVKGECQITVTAPALMHNGHEYVDLGLTSNGKPIYWATCNVGATQPEEYGDYFAWGETEPYYTEGHSQDNPCSKWKSGKSNGYIWYSYKWCSGSYDSQTKYCTSSKRGTVDNKTVLDSEDDAAAANWGGSWRMPTTEEQQELFNNCTWNWTTKNGVNGYNVVGPNGNSIFLSAAGDRYNSLLSLAGSYGYYWSSSLYEGESDIANGLGFFSGGRGWYGYDRYCGLSVRPVYMPNEVKATSISLSNSTLSLTVGGSNSSLTASVLPSNVSSSKICWVSSNSSIATVSKTGVVSPIGEGSCYITAITTDGTNLNASCFVRVNPITPDYNGHEYVDLGLPSGLMWATCNVGASKPEDYGDYFAWGETEPKLTYDISNYKYCNGSRSTLTKYCNNNRDGVVDNKTILESSDDAATANWGGSWRMPTDTEVTELITNCTWTRTFVNGFIGWNVSGNGNSIFLPVAGYRYNSWIDQEGSAGYYWLSSLGTDYSTIANNMGLSWTGPDIDYRSRDYAYPVRPVCSIAK